MSSPAKNPTILTPEQRHIYASEKLMNFRWISKVLATRSNRVLTSADLVSLDLHEELAELCQISVIAYSALPIEFVFDNLSMLSQADFPLEGYSVLQDSLLVAALQGKKAKLSAYVLYRPRTKQLVVVFRGTASFKQSLYDLRTTKRRHPAGRGCKVHTGFWKLYLGIKSQVVDAINKGIQEYDIAELVMTGHSMGGAMCDLLALDILADKRLLTSAFPLKLAIFGAPRCGNYKLTQYWQDMVNEYQKKHGPSSWNEYSVKAYKDGVPALPPYKFGFRHFSKTPLYFVRGHFYHIPISECEHSIFSVTSDEKDAKFMYPFGGHNYYSDIDLEKFTRRTQWLDEIMGNEDWEKRYRERVARRERGWMERQSLKGI